MEGIFSKFSAFVTYFVYFSISTELSVSLEICYVNLKTSLIIICPWRHFWYSSKNKICIATTKKKKKMLINEHIRNERMTKQQRIFKATHHHDKNLKIKKRFLNEHVLTRNSLKNNSRNSFLNFRLVSGFNEFTTFFMMKLTHFWEFLK